MSEITEEIKKALEEDSLLQIDRTGAWLRTLLEKIDHSKQMYDQVYDDRERMRAELDRAESHGPEGRNYTNAEYVSLLQERESLRTELAEKDKVLEWIRDAGTDYQSINKAREVLFQFKKGESQSEDA